MYRSRVSGYWADEMSLEPGSRPGLARQPGSAIVPFWPHVTGFSCPAVVPWSASGREALLYVVPLSVGLARKTCDDIRPNEPHQIQFEGSWQDAALLTMPAASSAVGHCGIVTPAGLPPTG